MAGYEFRKHHLGCSCIPDGDLAGCEFGYTWVVSLYGKPVAGGFNSRESAPRWTETIMGQAMLEHARLRRGEVPA